jgi:hypothetical protein
MRNEYLSHDEAGGMLEETTPAERLRWNHSEIRRGAKDLRIVLGQTAETFPHRERLFQLADEILQLVPIYDQEDEDGYERQTKAING